MGHPVCEAKFRNCSRILSAYPMGKSFSFGCQISQFYIGFGPKYLKEYKSCFENIEIKLGKFSQCAPHGHAFGLSAR